MGPRGADSRSRVRRRILLVATALLGAGGLTLTILGLLGMDTPLGQAFLCLGLGALVVTGGGVALELGRRSHHRQVLQPDLTMLPDGERALFLPRSRFPHQVSSGVLTGLAAVILLWALFAARAGAWLSAAILVAVAVALVWFATPGRAGAQAGGLWFTPTRIVHAHGGVRWELPWSEVTGAAPKEPMPVYVQPGRRPELERTAVAGRFRCPARVEDTMMVETLHLAGGGVLASYVVLTALADPAYRAELGTAASLPPVSSR